MSMTFDQLRLLRADQLVNVFFEDTNGSWYAPITSSLSNLEKCWRTGGGSLDVLHKPRNQLVSFDRAYTLRLYGHQGMISITSFGCTISVGNYVDLKPQLPLSVVESARKFAGMLGGYCKLISPDQSFENVSCVHMCHISGDRWSPTLAMYLLGRCVMDPGGLVLKDRHMANFEFEKPYTTNVPAKP